MVCEFVSVYVRDERGDEEDEDEEEGDDDESEPGG